MAQQPFAAPRRTRWLILLLAIISFAGAGLLLGIFEPTAQERLARATVSGDASSGHYPHCSADSLTQPGDCNDLRRLDPEYYTRESWSSQRQDVLHNGHVLHLAILTSPDGRDAFFNSVAIAPDGSPIAVGGPSLLISRPDHATPAWDVRKFSRFADALRGIAFHGGDLGLAVGNDGIIMRTRDAGQTWHAYNETYNTNNAPVLQSKLDGEAYAIAFVDKDIAISGGNQHMLRTTDAGQHWRAVPPAIGRQAIQEIAFSGPRNGWAVGTGGVVFRTRDGGEKWEAVEVASADTMLMGLDFVGEHGCMAGSWQVWCTADGGDSWTKSDVSLPPGAQENAGYDITRLRLVDARQGWFTTNAGHIYQTRNGGQTWRLWVNINDAGYAEDAEIWGLAVAEHKIWAVGSGRVSSVSDGIEAQRPAPLVLSWPRGAEAR